MVQARFPIYIPSKSRADIAKTPHLLDRMGVPYRLVVEEAQADEYAAVYGRSKLLILDPAYQADYDTCIPGFDDTRSKGSGPARNFIWDHAVSEGYPWHWIIDDNILYFFRLHQNHKINFGDALPFAAMEDFVLRYRNIALAGPQYDYFIPARVKHDPFRLNTRIFSCLLIRNDLALRWRARYNEDLDLSIRVLKAGWCTVLFNAFLQKKVGTQVLGGGNTEAFYASEGTAPKSELIVRLHPDICRRVFRYGRDHHEADLSQWKSRRLIRRDDAEIAEDDRYRMRKVPRPRPA